MREVLTGRLSVGEFIALYEQAQDWVFARAKEAGQIPPGARSDEVIFEFGRRVEKRVRERQEASREVCGNE